MDNFFQHKARKRFGQNFLVDENIIESIVRAINPQTDDNLVEIGPGQGAITTLLIRDCPTLKVIELDRDLIPMLEFKFREYEQFEIIEHDALKFDFDTLADRGPLRIVGNLPYNISTPLLFHLLTYHDKVRDMHFMLQKEVVDRLGAVPGDKAYGRLSVMVQYWCRVQALFPVPAHAFRPAPKVVSAIVRLVPHKELPCPARDEKLLSQVVNSAFQQRRKTLRNALKTHLGDTPLDDFPVDLGRRPETLSVTEYVSISNWLCGRNDAGEQA